jgi:hypothetical protein
MPIAPEDALTDAQVASLVSALPDDSKSDRIVVLSARGLGGCVVKHTHVVALAREVMRLRSLLRDVGYAS